MVIRNRLWVVKLEKFDTYYILADSFEKAEQIIKKWRPDINITSISLYIDYPIITETDIL